MKNIKKLLSAVLVAALLICALFCTPAFAAEASNNEVPAVLMLDDGVVCEEAEARASGLIQKKKFTLTKVATNTLMLDGYTIGSDEVVRTEIRDIVVQRRTSSSASWSEYFTIDDVVSESNECKYNVMFSCQLGYQYRVTAVHYAKKSWLSTQKISAVTETVTM